MTSRVRRYAATAVLLVAAPLGLPMESANAILEEACNTPTHEATSFCLSYEVGIVKSGGGDHATTQSQDPVDVEARFFNTSTSYRDEPNQPRWLKSLSLNLLSSSTIRPMVTGTASLPDGLLVGGNPNATMCGPGADNSFSTCTAGYGVAYVKASGFLSGIFTATFGIKQIRNETADLGSHFAQYTATIGVCLQSGFGACTLGEQVQEQTFTIDLPPAGQPMKFDFVMPPPTSVSGVNIEKFTVDQMRLKLNGQSQLLANGTTLAAPRTVVALPMRCGNVNASGTVTSRAGTTVSVAKPYTITGCSQLSLTSAPSRLTFGQSGVVNGTLTDFDTQTAMVGTEVQLRSCAPAATVPCSTTTLKRITTTGGAFSFPVKPSRNTRYFVRVDAVDGKPASWVTRLATVAPKVTRNLSRTSMPSGGTVKITGSVAPSHAGKVVRIQRRVSGVWKTIASATLSSRSAYAKSLTLRGTRGTTASLRVVLPAHADHATGTSPVVGIRFS